MKPTRSNPKRGFTLVELLIVIVIVAVLASLIFMFARRGIQRAHSASDITRLRNLGSALAAVVSDDGRYPLSQQQGGSWTYWMDEIRAAQGGPSSNTDHFTVSDVEPFISLRLGIKIPADTEGNTLRSLKHYAATEAVMPWRTNSKGYNGVPSAAIRRPAETAMLVDGNPKNELGNCDMNLWGEFRSNWYGGNLWPKADKAANANDIIGDTGPVDFRHDGKAHVLFVDGHVQSMGPKELKYKYFSNAY